MASSIETLPDVPKKRPPARTPEARENELIALAYDLVERRLREGTATSQETTHFLKRGSAKDKLEQDILREQKKLIGAKTEALGNSKKMEEIYSAAIAAMKSYGGYFEGGRDD